MAKVNAKSKTTTKVKRTTFEGGKAVKLTPAQELKRAVCASLLFEDTFYESGEEIANRIKTLAGKVSEEDVNDIIYEAKFKGKLRHTPLFLAVNALDRVHREVLTSLFTRPDDITDFIALWWKDGKKPLKKKMKKAINDALNTFDAYQLAKYKGSKSDAVKMVDVFNLTHPKAKDESQNVLFRSLVNGELKAADTWEVALSAGKDKGETFSKLMAEKKLGGMAFFRNLRNMLEGGVSEKEILAYMKTIKTDKLLPINLYAAGRIMEDYSVKIQSAVEEKLVDMLKNRPKLEGKTAIVVDTSISMWGAMAGKSKFERVDYALAMATILQGICEKSQVIFFNDKAKVIKGKTGFALYKEASNFRGGTDHAEGLKLVDKDVDRVIMITDEQSSSNDRFKFDKAYMINVAGYQNSIAYDPWVSISGFSDKVVDFIFEYETLE